MTEWLSSDVPWPQRHQRGYWNDALAIARTHKWFFRYSGKGHTFGRIACKPNPGAHPQDEVCAQVIFKTGEGNPQSVADDTVKMILACPHSHSSNAAEPPDLAAVTRMLREADILLDAADRLITSQGDMSDAQMLFEQALSATGAAADELEQQAVDAEQEATRNEDLAKTNLRRLADEYPLEAEALIEAGDSRVEAAEAVKEESLASAVTRLRDRIVRLRSRVASQE